MIILFTLLILFGISLNIKDKSNYDKHLEEEAREAQIHLWKMLEAINRHKKLEGKYNEANHHIYR